MCDTSLPYYTHFVKENVVFSNDPDSQATGMYVVLYLAAATYLETTLLT